MPNMNLHLLSAAIDHDYSPELALSDWRAYRVANGWGPRAPILGPPRQIGKPAKNRLPTFTNALAPSISGGHNVCDHSTRGCRPPYCVALAGNGRYEATTNARALRVSFLYDNPSAYGALMGHELDRGLERYGEIACRPNAFSDIAWHLIFPELFDRPVSFYDYTKDWTRRPRPNYHLTYSATEHTTDDEIRARVGQGANVAVIFSTARGRALPATYAGCPVIDGDLSDYRPA